MLGPTLGSNDSKFSPRYSHPQLRGFCFEPGHDHLNWGVHFPDWAIIHPRSKVILDSAGFVLDGRFTIHPSWKAFVPDLHTCLLPSETTLTVTLFPPSPSESTPWDKKSRLDLSGGPNDRWTGELREEGLPAWDQKIMSRLNQQSGWSINNLGGQSELWVVNQSSGAPSKFWGLIEASELKRSSEAQS